MLNKIKIDFFCNLLIQKKMFYHKSVGETTSEFANRVSQLHNGAKTCACGKLDPMARGITRVLVGDKTKEMEKHLNSNKTYEFYIVPGISTDSDDIMGLIDNVSENISAQDIINIKTYMDNTISNLYTQKFHHYSALRLRKNGERHPLWYWYKKGLLDEEEIPEKKVNVYNLEFLKLQTIPKDYYLKNILDRLSKITHKDQFRVKDITKKWSALNYNKSLLLLKFKIKVSSGFYVRMIAKQIKKDLGVPVHIYDIHRTNVD